MEDFEKDRWQKSSSSWRHLTSQIRPQTQKFNEVFLPFITNNHPITLLDLASGTGEPLATFCQTKHPKSLYIGSDFIFSMISKLPEDNLPIAPILTDMRALPFKKECCDLITSRFGVSFLTEQEWRPFLTQIHTLLKPNGQALFLIWGPTEQNTIWSWLSQAYQDMKTSCSPDLFKGLFSLSQKTSLNNFLSAWPGSSQERHFYHFNHTIPFSPNLYTPSMELILSSWMQDQSPEQQALFHHKVQQSALKSNSPKIPIHWSVCLLALKK